MEPEAGEEPAKQEVTKSRRRRRPLLTMLMWDVISDRDSQPVFYWAASALLIGTLAYHWLEGWS